jgi:large subunit GTPase 1
MFNNICNGMEWNISHHLISVDENGNPRRLVVGMIGYPNVGKSSTINALCNEKKVAVSATPGKTKHFQVS